MHLRKDDTLTLNLEQHELEPLGFALSTYIHRGPKGRKTSEKELNRYLLRPKTPHADQVVLTEAQADVAQRAIQFAARHQDAVESLLWQTIALRQTTPCEVLGMDERRFFDFIQESVGIFGVAELDQDTRE